MYAEEMWMHVSLGSRAPPIPPPPQPCIFNCSLLFFLLTLGVVAIDLGPETNGFWARRF